jgi:DNA ligase-1
MKLYEIIKALQNATGINAKRDILAQHKDNELLKQYMKATYDPAINYYITKVPEFVLSCGEKHKEEFSETDIQLVIENLAQRFVTGKAAKKWLEEFADAQNMEGHELLTYLIKVSICAGVGETLVLDNWPDLFFIPPYQRCSLMDEKIKNKFKGMPFFYVQTKLDGTFCYLEKSADGIRAITRAGSLYPQWFADRFARGFDSGVLVGELEVYKWGMSDPDGSGDWFLLDRKTGNGILNSVLQGGDESEFKDYLFKHTSWDWLTNEEFKAGKSGRELGKRFVTLSNMLLNAPHYLGIVDNWQVTSLADAYKIYSEHTAKGLEGCVIKAPDSLWKDGTAKDIVKLKIKFEAEYEVIGMTEGTGKYKGMMGSLTIVTSDKLLVSDLGTGFSDDQRKEFWANAPEIVTVSANDVISKRTDGIKSLFLPAFEEARWDKTEADSLERVIAQLEAAKNGQN